MKKITTLEIKNKLRQFPHIKNNTSSISGVEYNIENDVCTLKLTDIAISGLINVSIVLTGDCYFVKEIELTEA